MGNPAFVPGSGACLRAAPVLMKNDFIYLFAGGVGCLKNTWEPAWEQRQAPASPAALPARLHPPESV